MKNLTNLPPLCLAFALLPAFFGVSCSTPQKYENTSTEDLPQLFGFLKPKDEAAAKPAPSVTEELKRIANSPTSRRPRDRKPVAIPAETETEAGSIALADITVTDPPIPTAAELTTTAPAAQKPKVPFSSNRISIGDIFSDNQGMRLRKSVSVADTLPNNAKDARSRLFGRITKSESYKVPLTISQDELTQLKQKSMTERPMPSRSVALDFESRKKSATPEDLEVLFGKLTAGSISELKDHKAAESQLNENMKQAKARLSRGEKLYVVTGVTESDKMVASYPGAPVGTRDAEPIKNAVETMFPQLDHLEATKHGEKIELQREDGLYWGFESRELKLENDQIVIDRKASIQH